MLSKSFREGKTRGGSKSRAGRMGTLPLDEQVRDRDRETCSFDSLADRRARGVLKEREPESKRAEARLAMNRLRALGFGQGEEISLVF